MICCISGFLLCIRDSGAKWATILLEDGNLVFQIADMSQGPDQQPYLGAGEGFLDIVGSSPSHSLNRRFDGRIGGDHHHLHPWSLGEQRGERVHAVLSLQPEVNEGNIEGAPFRLSQRLLGSSDRDNAVAFGLQAIGEGFADVALIIDDENIEYATGRGHRPAASAK